MIKIRSILVGFIFSSLVLAANAAEVMPVNNRYVELNAGTNFYYAGVLSNHGTSGGFGAEGFGWNANYGYHFSPLFALEAGFMQNFFGYDRSSFLNVPFITTRYEIELSQPLFFIGKLGAMFPMGKSSGVLLPYTGIGLGYRLSSKTDFNIQYQGAFYGVAGAGLLGIGFTYHF